MTSVDGEQLAIAHLLANAGSMRAGEQVLLVVDDTTRDLVSDFRAAATALGAHLELAELPVASAHGVEPTGSVTRRMGDAHLVIGLTKMSLAHTRARHAFCAGGGRYLSMPGYSRGLLSDPCLLVDYRAQLPLARALADAFTAGSAVRVTTARGTDMRLRIDGRVGNCCPGFVDDENPLGSPPDIEANVSPLEDASDGIAVVDGSVTCDAIGLLEAPVTLEVRRGRVTGIRSSRSEYVSAVQALFSSVGDPNASVLAECGLGLNPMARVTGNMLTDEGVLGSVHFGFGSNATVGGVIDVPFHVDFVLLNASVWIDDQQVFRAGHPCLRTLS